MVKSIFICSIYRNFLLKKVTGLRLISTLVETLATKLQDLSLRQKILKEAVFHRLVPAGDRATISRRVWALSFFYAYDYLAP